MIFLICKERNIDVFKCMDRNYKLSVGSCSICVGLENIVLCFVCKEICLNNSDICINDIIVNSIFFCK